MQKMTKDDENLLEICTNPQENREKMRDAAQRRKECGL